MDPITITLEPDPDGGYTATIDTMPGCITEGETIPETLRNLADAAEVWQA